MRILAVDPGQSGGYVGVTMGGLTLVEKWTNLESFVDFVRDFDPDQAWVEKVHSYPQQGVASTFKFGTNFGMIQGVLAALLVETHLVSPQKWQSSLNLPKAKTKTEHKNNLKDIAKSRYPDFKWTLATCDAILIADYGVRNAKII